MSPATPDGSFGVFDALLLGKKVFGRGSIMAHIDASGRVDLDSPMEYDSYVLHLRHALVTVGVPGDEAQQFTAHSCTPPPDPRHCGRQVDRLARGIHAC